MIQSVLKLIVTLGFALTIVMGCSGGGGGMSSTTPSQAVSGGSPSTPSTPQSPIDSLETPPAAPIGSDYLPQNKGWSLVWADEFDGDTLDRSKWLPEETCWGGGNNERQCYTDRETNVDVVNGLLRLKAFEEKFTGNLNPPEWNSPGTGTQDYTSGKVRTLGLADWKYGRFSARIKAPKGQGIWPAFWMMPVDSVYGGWPLSGEIDIYEAVNLGADCADCQGNVGENKTHGTIHFGQSPPNNKYYGKDTYLPDNAQPGDSYHVYAVEWGEGKINWYLNDQLYFSATKDDWFTSAQNAIGNASAPFDQNFYVMLNLAIGGNWPEGANETGLDPQHVPNQMLVDWVRVHQCAPDPDKGLACMG